MIFLFMLLFSLLLLVVGFYLLKKQEVFFTLIPDTQANTSFLTTFGIIYSFTGILGILVAFFNHEMVTLLYIFFVLLIAAFFSIRLAGKMKRPQ